MKNFKRLTAILCMFMVTFVITLNGLGLGSINNKLVYADVKDASFVVVGDSISYGMSADPGNGFADLYLKHLNSLGSYGNAKLTNLSIPGDKSSDLLQKLSTQSFMDPLSKADIVAVSIGGNNLLSTVIAAISKAFNINTTDNPKLLDDLTNALKTDKDAFAKLFQLTSPESMITIQAALAAGVDNFKTEFPKIAIEIKRQAPNVQLYVLNLYNPFAVNDKPLYDIFNEFISGINTVIATQAQATGFIVVDVNKAFTGNSEAVKFNLLTAQIDPHPTNVGHDTIYKELIAVEKPSNNSNSIPTVSTDTSSTQVDNQKGTNSNGGTDQGPTGLTDIQRDTLTKALTAGKQEKLLAQKSLKKYQGDVVKYDKDYKNLKVKGLKLKTSTEKSKLNLQLATVDAQRSAAVAYVSYYKAVITKDDLIVKTNQGILDLINPSVEEINSAQINIASAEKFASAKKVEVEKAINLAKQAASKAAKVK